MIERIILVPLFFLFSLSCTTAGRSFSQPIVEEKIHPCGENSDTTPEIKEGITTSIIKIVSIVKNSDTLPLDNLICLDSNRLESVLLSGIKVSKYCIEKRIVGKSYFEVEINEAGNFINFKVLRNTETCLDLVNEQLKSKLENTSVLSKKHFNTVLVFYHDFRIVDD